MADVKISQLPAAASIASTDVAPVVTGGVTSKVTAQAIVNGGLSGGTANGVLYLDGSKAATSGSALTFTGSVFGLNGSGMLQTITSTGDFSSTGTAYLRWYDSVGAKGYIGYAGTASTLTLASSMSGLELQSNTYTAFTLGASEQMRLTSTGLGIGTSSPQAKLQVLNTLKVSSADQSSGNVILGDGSSTYFSVGIGRWNGATNAAGAGGLGYFSQGSVNGGGHYWYTGDAVAGSTTECMRLDTAGNLGLGVTPSAWGALNIKALQVSNGGFANNGGSGYITNNAYYASGYTPTYISTNPAEMISFNRTGNNDIQFLTAPSGTAGDAISFTQSMTLDASGNLLVGTTSASGSGASSGKQVLQFNGATANGLYIDDTRTAAGTDIPVIFGRGATEVGKITTTTTTTAYTSSSDYRLKHDILPMQGALETVSKLNPVTYKWNLDNSDGQGFIAHELQAVIPEAVTGEKDAVDDEGNPVYQGIDPSKIVATLTAAIQEQQAIIESLTARITTLEGK